LDIFYILLLKFYNADIYITLNLELKNLENVMNVKFNDSVIMEFVFQRGHIDLQ